MQTTSKIICALLVAVVTGCTHLIPSNPNTYSVDAAAVSRLRGSQTVALNNAYDAETVIVIFEGGGSTWKTDLKQVTDTAIIMLSRAMEKQGIRVAPHADKSLTLRVHQMQGGLVGAPLLLRARVGLILELGYLDGTKRSIDASDTSINGAPRAIDGAILAALNELLRDDQFVAYMNR